MHEIASEDEVDEISKLRLGADSLEISSGDLSKIRSKLRTINDGRGAAGSDLRGALEDCITASTLSTDRLTNCGPMGPMGAEGPMGPVAAECPAGAPDGLKPDTVLTIDDAPAGAVAVTINGRGLRVTVSSGPSGADGPPSRLPPRLSVARDAAFAVVQLVLLVLLGALIVAAIRAVAAWRP